MWLEKKYVFLLGSSLERFKQKSDNVWNLRCPLCNDSKKNKAKTRGYILLKGGKYFYYCHNCNASHRFDTFLRLINPTLYDSYLFEKLSLEETQEKVIETLKPVSNLPSIPVDKLKKVSQLSPFDAVKKYVVSRQIPTPWHAKLYYCPMFRKFTNSVLPGKFAKTDPDEGRIILPIRNVNGQMVGYQGRWLKKEEPRYITIMVSDEYPRLFNVENCDFNRKYYCLEGPFDSMFLPNAIAACGGKIAAEVDKLNKLKHNAVIVYDNEPRNKDIVNSMSKSIQMGYKICIWPDGHQGKDVNEMILRKVNPGEYVRTELIEKAGKKIKEVIDDNTFHGLSAELRLTEWRKV